MCATLLTRFITARYIIYMRKTWIRSLSKTKPCCRNRVSISCCGLNRIITSYPLSDGTVIAPCSNQSDTLEFRYAFSSPVWGMMYADSLSLSAVCLTMYRGTSLCVSLCLVVSYVYDKCIVVCCQLLGGGRLRRVVLVVMYIILIHLSHPRHT